MMRDGWGKIDFYLNKIPKSEYGCVERALFLVREQLEEGKTPHIVWLNRHAYVITEENPDIILNHDGDKASTLERIRKIMLEHYHSSDGCALRNGILMDSIFE